jgi:hypothetical protein
MCEVRALAMHCYQAVVQVTSVCKTTGCVAPCTAQREDRYHGTMESGSGSVGVGVGVGVGVAATVCMHT